jgi:hypothetical protein
MKILLKRIASEGTPNILSSFFDVLHPIEKLEVFLYEILINFHSLQIVSFTNENDFSQYFRFSS